MGGFVELLLHVMERSDGGSLGKGGRKATVPRGSSERRRHCACLCLTSTAIGHVVGLNPHTREKVPTTYQMPSAVHAIKRTTLIIL